MENVYLIVTDLHLSLSKPNRYDYEREGISLLRNIKYLADKYKERGCNVNVIFLGDIFDMSYKKLTGAIYAVDMLHELGERYKLYSLVGNHETSFYKDNPFWSCFSTVDSTRVKNAVRKSWRPVGYRNTLHIVDEIIDGEVAFLFNHHGCPKQVPYKDKINIGLYHDTINCTPIVNDCKQKYFLDIFVQDPKDIKKIAYATSETLSKENHMVSEDDYIDALIDLDKNESYFYGYNYVYLAHMHKLYGKYDIVYDKIDNSYTRVRALASLGRPNHTEVSNDFLERSIPAIIVKDGVFVAEEDNKLNLFRREDVVIEKVVEMQQASYQKRKHDKRITNYEPLTDDPLKNITSALSAEPSILGELSSIIKKERSETDKYVCDILMKYRI